MKFWLVILAVIGLSGVKANGGTLAQFEFQFGTVDVELFQDEKPRTVANFLQYHATGGWNPTWMHRWLSDFIIQGGSYFVASNSFELIPRNAPVPSEFNVGPRLSNTYGTLAMALAPGDPNSGTTSWFFNVKDNSATLDPQEFTVFGRTLRGTNVLNRFKATPGDPSAGMYVLGTNEVEREIPIYATNGTPYYVFANVVLLQPRIARVTGGMAVSWKSIEGLPNILEYRTVTTASWQGIATNIGTGVQVSVTNNPGSDPYRTYRVRIDYPR